MIIDKAKKRGEGGGGVEPECKGSIQENNGNIFPMKHKMMELMRMPSGCTKT